jgi:hypothetical protein
VEVIVEILEVVFLLIVVPLVAIALAVVLVTGFVLLVEV